MQKNFVKKVLNGFSLAQAIIMLVTLSTIFIATTPIITKKQSNDCLWKYNNFIKRGEGENPVDKEYFGVYYLDSFAKTVNIGTDYYQKDTMFTLKLIDASANSLDKHKYMRFFLKSSIETDQEEKASIIFAKNNLGVGAGKVLNNVDFKSINNIGIGYNSLNFWNKRVSSNNIAIGNNVLSNKYYFTSPPIDNTTNSDNMHDVSICIGQEVLNQGYGSINIGTMIYDYGFNNVIIGTSVGLSKINGSNNTIIGNIENVNATFNNSSIISNIKDYESEIKGSTIIGFDALGRKNCKLENSIIIANNVHYDANQVIKEKIAIGNRIEVFSDSPYITIGINAGGHADQDSINVGIYDEFETRYLGKKNIFIGTNINPDNENSNDNTVFGYYSDKNSLKNIKQSVILGAEAFSYPKTGTSLNENNVIIGYKAAANFKNGSSNNVVIGPNAGPTKPSIYNNTLYIHNKQSDFPLIHGYRVNVSGHEKKVLRINGKLSFKKSIIATNKYEDVLTSTNLNKWVENNKKMANINSNKTIAISFSELSDRKLKYNIKNTNVGINELNNIVVKDFTWKNDIKKQINTGVVAQEIRKCFPQLVLKNKTSGYLTIDTNSLFFIGINTIKQLDKKLTNLKNERKSLEKRLTQLEQKIYSKNGV